MLATVPRHPAHWGATPAQKVTLRLANRLLDLQGLHCELIPAFRALGYHDLAAFWEGGRALERAAQRDLEHAIEAWR